jgi:hypothetical protein
LPRIFIFIESPKAVLFKLLNIHVSLNHFSGFIKQKEKVSGMVTHAYNPNNQEAEAAYMRPYLKINKQTRKDIKFLKYNVVKVLILGMEMYMLVGGGVSVCMLGHE